jgi:hypothetical protein
LKSSGCRRGPLGDAVQSSELDRLEIATIDRVLEMILRLRERSPRDIEESRKIGVRSPAETFSDVTRRRRRSVADLIVETKVSFDLRSVR